MFAEDTLLFSFTHGVSDDGEGSIGSLWRRNGFCCWSIVFLSAEKLNQRRGQTLEVLVEPGTRVMIGGGLKGVFCAVLGFAYFKISKGQKKE